MDLSKLTIRELFAELTTVEDTLQGRTEKKLSASRRRVLKQHESLLFQELRSRTPEETFTVPTSPSPAGHRHPSRDVCSAVPLAASGAL